jgi:hypothetical protein
MPTAHEHGLLPGALLDEPPPQGEDDPRLDSHEPDPREIPLALDDLEESVRESASAFRGTFSAEVDAGSFVRLLARRHWAG